MRTKIGAGIVAGLIGGLFFGMGMQMMTAPTPDGGSMPVIHMVGMIIGAHSAVGGWLYHMFNSAVIGALFGLLLGSRATSWTSGLGWGLAYGLVWWVLGGLVLMPVLLGMPAFAPLTVAMMQPVAWGSLMGHLVYGAVTGLAFCRLYKRETIAPPPREVREKAGTR